MLQKKFFISSVDELKGKIYKFFLLEEMTDEDQSLFPSVRGRNNEPFETTIKRHLIDILD